MTPTFEKVQTFMGRSLGYRSFAMGDRAPTMRAVMEAGPRDLGIIITMPVKASGLLP